MKKTMLISLLCIASIGAYAQSSDKPVTINNAVCKSFPDMPARAKPVFPKTTYTPLEDASCPPCYEYRSKYGYMVMECPYLRFPAEHTTTVAGVSLVTEETPIGGGIQVQSQNSYGGNYPAVCKRAPNMPLGAKPVFPKSAYTPLEDPTCAPCYEYKSKYGYMVMECPFLRFPAEHTQK